MGGHTIGGSLYLLLAPVVALWNDPEALRLFNQLLFLGMAVVLWWGLRDWAGPAGALFAVFALIASERIVALSYWPIHPNFSLFFAFLYAAAILRGAVGGHRGWLIFSGLLLGILTQLHFSYFLLVLCHVLLVLFGNCRPDRWTKPLAIAAGLRAVGAVSPHRCRAGLPEYCADRAATPVSWALSEPTIRQCRPSAARIRLGAADRRTAFERAFAAHDAVGGTRHRDRHRFGRGVEDSQARPHDAGVRRYNPVLRAAVRADGLGHGLQQPPHPRDRARAVHAGRHWLWRRGRTASPRQGLDGHGRDRAASRGARDKGSRFRRHDEDRSVRRRVGRRLQVARGDRHRSCRAPRRLPRDLCQEDNLVVGRLVDRPRHLCWDLSARCGGVRRQHPRCRTTTTC